MIDLFVLGGPTAVGKTDISIKLAKELNGEIISADSMQIYKHMDVGSAKIKEEEKQGIPHYLIDIKEPSENFSVAEFKQMAESLIKDIHSRGKLPMIVGGTGLYINSVICSYDFKEADTDEEYRMYLENLAKEKGNEYVHSLLRDIDEISFNKIHFNNLRRVIRALEVYKLTGQPISNSKGEEFYSKDYNVKYFVLNMDRAILYDRINKRVDIMLNNGLIAEVEKLQSMGCTKYMQSMKGIGYKEIIEYLSGKYSFDEVVELIKKNSRNYAKRQLTWFRRDPRVNWVDKFNFENEQKIVEYIENIVKNKNISYE